MSPKTQKVKTMHDLIEEIELHFMMISDYIEKDNNLSFISSMDEFRLFLKNACILANGYLQLYEQFKEQPEHQRYKDFFMFCENYHERLIELQEKSNIINYQEPINSIKECLTMEYNKKFSQDINNELQGLDQYIKISQKFVMVGCGSLPITLFSVCEKYQNLQAEGIDNSAEAIINAKDLKNKIGYENVTLQIIDGLNYNYYNADTIFIANLVIPKTKVLKRIAMTSKPGTKILLRVPVMYGSLLSEDVNFVSLQSFKQIAIIEPTRETDDILYKTIVLEKI